MFETTISVSDNLKGYLAAMRELGGDSTGMNAMIAGRAESVTRDWLIEQAKVRHKTAQRLGATPTGHLERAAESVTSASDAQGATIGITSPGISRAFGPLDIKPSAGKKYLTIPATAEAYGRRAGSFNDLRLAFFRRAGTLLLALVKADQSSLATRESSGYGIESKAAKGAKAPLQAAQRPAVYYWLKSQVTVPQDRSLLPDDQTYGEAAEDGVRDYLTYLRQANGI